jgi:hypothetical protein
MWWQSWSRDDAKTELGGGLGGYDRFRTFSLVAAVDAVNFRRWPGPTALEGIIALFSKEPGGLGQVEEFLFFDRQLGPSFRFPGLGLTHRIIKALDGNFPVPIMQRGQKAAHDRSRIRDCTSEYSRM